MDASELQTVLTRSGLADYPRPGGTFSLETCRVMIAMLDADQEGELDFAEFKQLSEAIKGWQGTFQRFDRDRSGTIGIKELAEAIHSYGYRLTPKTLDIVTKRYSKHGNDQISVSSIASLPAQYRVDSRSFFLPV